MSIEHTVGASVITKIAGLDITRDELELWFSRVCDPSNWKLPINTRVSANWLECQIIAAAVEFFTGGAATITKLDLDHGVRVQAPGYYVSVGA